MVAGWDSCPITGTAAAVAGVILAGYLFSPVNPILRASCLMAGETALLPQWSALDSRNQHFDPIKARVFLVLIRTHLDLYAYRIIGIEPDQKGSINWRQLLYTGLATFHLDLGSPITDGCRQAICLIQP